MREVGKKDNEEGPEAFLFSWYKCQLEDILLIIVKGCCLAQISW